MWKNISLIKRFFHYGEDGSLLSFANGCYLPSGMGGVFAHALRFAVNAHRKWGNTLWEANLLPFFAFQRLHHRTLYHVKD